MDQKIVQKLLRIRVQGFDDARFKLFHEQLAGHRDKFSRPYDVLLEHVGLFSSAHKLVVELSQEDDAGIAALTRLICSLPIVVERGSMPDFSYKGMTPDSEIIVILEHQMRMNHLTEIFPLVPVASVAPFKMAA